MNNNLVEKQRVVEEIKEKISKAKSIVFVDYKGTNVSQDTKIRSEFRANNSDYKVYKNRLMLRALNELGITGMESYLEGTTSVAFGYDSETAPAKVVNDAMKENPNMQIKCGIIEGKVVDSDYVKMLANIPSKEVLVAQLLSMLQAPVRSLAIALKAISEKNQ